MIGRRTLLTSTAAALALPAIIRQAGAQSSFDWKRFKGEHIEVLMAKSEKLGGAWIRALQRARRESWGRAIAARVAADAALGAAQALADHVRWVAGLAVTAAEDQQQLQLFAAVG